MLVIIRTLCIQFFLGGASPISPLNFLIYRKGIWGNLRFPIQSIYNFVGGYGMFSSPQSIYIFVFLFFVCIWVYILHFILLIIILNTFQLLLLLRGVHWRRHHRHHHRLSLGCCVSRLRHQVPLLLLHLRHCLPGRTNRLERRGLSFADLSLASQHLCLHIQVPPRQLLGWCCRGSRGVAPGREEVPLLLVLLPHCAPLRNDMRLAEAAVDVSSLELGVPLGLEHIVAGPATTLGCGLHGDHG